MNHLGEALPHYDRAAQIILRDINQLQNDEKIMVAAHASSLLKMIMLMENPSEDEGKADE